MSEPTHLLWTDFETTSADPETTDVIEAAFQLTTVEDFKNVLFTRHFMVQFSKWPSWDPVARQMHVDSGLLAEHRQARTFTPSTVASEVLLAFQDVEVDPAMAIIAGSGVARFDRIIMKRAMTALYRELHYRELDISSIRGFLRMAGIEWMLPPPNSKPHRALGDLVAIRDEAQSIRDWIVRAATLTNPHDKET